MKSLQVFLINGRRAGESFEATRSAVPGFTCTFSCHDVLPVQFCSGVMAISTRYRFIGDRKRRRLLSTSENSYSLEVNAPDFDQCTWRRSRRNRYSVRILLLLLGLFVAPMLASSSPIDYGSLTWSEWGDIFTPIATDSIALRKIYSGGPCVRAKIMVSTQISMDDLQTGEAIFRQHIREIVEVETIDRIRIEYLQTDAGSETEQSVYYVALSTSALLPPSSSTSYDSSTSALMLPAIETERGRIVENLKYGKILATGNMTIDNLTLFGVPMKLVDIVLDGEAFVQIYLKPWLGVQLAIASTDSVDTGVCSGNNKHYTIDLDAFQELRLRFLLVQRLKSLQIRASDIIIHPPTNLLPFSTYGADVGVLEIEIHVHDTKYAEFVEMYLLDDKNSSSGMSNNVIAEKFNEIEPQWELIAMDIDTTAGKLFSPASQPSTSFSSDGKGVSELTFEMYNISLAHLERTKWLVLDFIRMTLAPVVSSRVRFGRIDFPLTSFALSNLAIYNDGGGDGVVTEDGFTPDTIFDPINAINWTLSFKVELETTHTFDSTMLAGYIKSIQNMIETGLQHVLGFTNTANTQSTTFRSASDWVDLELNDASSVEPSVSFSLTIQVEPLDASGTILESPNFFHLHYARSALVLLLQQVAISNDQVSVEFTKVVDYPTVQLDESQHSLSRLLFVVYRVTISDESQRRGIRSVVFSHRLASLISLYSGTTLKLIERQIDLHADGSPIWPRYLPGVYVVAPKADNISDGFNTSSSSILEQYDTAVYDFNDPEPSATSGVLVDATDVCSFGTTTSTSSSAGLCFRLRFTGSTQVASIFLRTLQSLHPVASSSINLPPKRAPLDPEDPIASYPAPWILIGDQNDDTVWTFLVDRTSQTSQDQSICLTFAAVDNLQDTISFTLDVELDPEDLTTAPFVRRGQFGDLAVVSKRDQTSAPFIFAELPELTHDGVEITDVSVTLHMLEPRLMGLYSSSLLDEVAPQCSACIEILANCNSKLECRAFSACTSVLLDTDLTLISTMLQKYAIGTSVDVSWLLEDCLSPSDGTVWSSTIREILVSSFMCLWQNHCPLVYSDTFSRQLILDYAQGEQVLEFQLVDGFASVSFTLDSDQGESTYEFTEDFTTNSTDVTTQLDAILTEMYRAAQSNVATVESMLSTTTATGTGVVTAHLIIHYLFLGRLPLLLVEITQSGSIDNSLVTVTAPKETLHLRVDPSAP